MTEGNPNIQVEITDARDIHCFRLVLNPQGHAPDCDRAMDPAGACTCSGEGEGTRIEIMFHARSLVDLIHKCSSALCDWQTETTQYLLDRWQLPGGGRKNADPA